MPPPTLLNCILSTLALLLFIYSLFRALHRQKTSTEPTCAHCGYTVLALTTPTCPECGSHLPTTGILPPRKFSFRPIRALVLFVSFFLPNTAFVPRRKRPIRIFHALLFSFAFLAAATLLTFAANIFLTRHTIETGLTFSEQAPLTPRTIPTAFLLLHASSLSSNPPVNDLYLLAAGPSPGSGAAVFSAAHGWTVTLRNGPLATVAWSRATNQWTLATPTTSTTTKSLTPADLAPALAAINPSTNPDAVTELTELLLRAQKSDTLGDFTPDPVPYWLALGTTARTADDPPTLVLTITTWLLVFLYALTLPKLLFPPPPRLKGEPAAHLLALPSSAATPT